MSADLAVSFVPLTAKTGVKVKDGRSRLTIRVEEPSHESDLPRFHSECWIVK